MMKNGAINHFARLFRTLCHLFQIVHAQAAIFDFGVAWKRWWQYALIDHRRETHRIWCISCNQRKKRNYYAIRSDECLQVLQFPSGCVPSTMVRLINGITSMAPFSSRTISPISCSFGDMFLFGHSVIRACSIRRKNRSRCAIAWISLEYVVEGLKTVQLPDKQIFSYLWNLASLIISFRLLHQLLFGFFQHKTRLRVRNIRRQRVIVVSWIKIFFFIHFGTAQRWKFCIYEYFEVNLYIFKFKNFSKDLKKNMNFFIMKNFENSLVDI